MNEKSSKKSVIIGIIALIVIVAVIGVIYCIFRPGTQSGSKDITINVINSSGETSSYEVATDAEYLQGAMDDADGLSYETDSTDMGLSPSTEKLRTITRIRLTGRFTSMANTVTTVSPSSLLPTAMSFLLNTQRAEDKCQKRKRLPLPL